MLNRHLTIRAFMLGDGDAWSAWPCGAEPARGAPSAAYATTDDALAQVAQLGLERLGV